MTTAQLAQQTSGSVAVADCTGFLKIAGYVAVEVRCAGSARWIYMRSHAPGVLFLANLPPQMTSATIKRVVPMAAVEDDAVHVQAMPGSRNRFARIRLRGGEEDVSATLSAPRDWLALECLEDDRSASSACPAAQWVQEYWNSRDADAVEKWSAATMDTFERCERARERREKEEAERAALPDDDGFVVVRRGASAHDTAGGVNAMAFNAQAMEKRAAVKKRRTKGVQQGIAPDGFYRWQRRQGRKRELEELRKRFEDDKKRVAAVRGLEES